MKEQSAHPLSTRERINPGEIRRQTGYMETCESCGSRYRRMCIDFRIPAICGCCTIVYPLQCSNELA
jgi:hypothetical protein